MVGKKVLMAPTAFWHHVKAQNGELFSERDYEFHQEDQSTDGNLN